MGMPLIADPFWEKLIRQNNEANKNVDGNWTRAELRQSAAVFNASNDPAERKRELVKCFSANYTRKVRIGEVVYVPERLVDRKKYFLRGLRKSVLHPLTCPAGRAMILGNKIVAYGPLGAEPCLENASAPLGKKMGADASLWKRVLEVPLEKIEKIVLRRDQLLFIQL